MDSNGQDEVHAMSRSASSIGMESSRAEQERRQNDNVDDGTDVYPQSRNYFKTGVQRRLEEKECENSVNSKKKRRLEETYVYIANNDDLMEGTGKPCKLRGRTMTWCATGTKFCYECRSPDHMKRQREAFKSFMDRRTHMRAVQEFSHGGSLKLVTGKSFASVAKSNANPPKTTVTPLDQSRTEMTTLQPAQQERPSAVSKELQELSALESGQKAKIQDLEEQVKSMGRIIVDFESRLTQTMNAINSKIV
ncbi:hypothetical protein BG004_001856 [Podila humilis]|nr:hypothetical protein BG004_001856 [Podila humilis]